jgi:signal peptidase I
MDRPVRILAMSDRTKAQKSSKPKKEKSKHPFRDNIEVVVFAVAMSLGLKVFALEAYQIPTGSMQPTLMGTDLIEGGRPVGGVHDRVLVDKICYLLRDPQRWEVVVFRYPLAATNNYVKRLVGMPGEELWVRDGDIWARPLDSLDDFKILTKPDKVQDYLWKRVFPRPGMNPARWTNWKLISVPQPADDGQLELSAGGVVSFPSATRGIKDEYRDGYDDKIVPKIPVAGTGANSNRIVSDLRFQFSLTARDSAAKIGMEAECGAFPFQIQLQAGSGQSHLRLPDDSLVKLDFECPTGEEIEVDFAFWDHHYRLRLNDQEWVGDIDGPPRPAGRNGFLFRSEGNWKLTPVKIFRDTHYLPSLEGGSGLFEIPQEHYFMMGDNTQNSLDSRDWTARVVRFDPPLDGVSEVRGDNLPGGADPQYNNPRWSRDSERMTIRDQWGDLHAFTRDQLALANSDSAQIEAAHFVPRNYIQGKALAVFLPIPPFAPVWRMGWVH